MPHQQLSKVPEAAGLHWARCEGSHNTFRNAEGRIGVVPDHGSQVTVRQLLRKILRDMGVSIEVYLKALVSKYL